MFELESVVAEWRKQMRAAGIKSRETLDELESHLRERIEQLGLRLPVNEAFQIAASELGGGNCLKSEFAKVNGFASRTAHWLRSNRSIALMLVGLWFIARGFHEAHFPLLGYILGHPQLHYGGLIPWMALAALQIPIGIGLFSRQYFWRIAALLMATYKIYLSGSIVVSLTLGSAASPVGWALVFRCVDLAVYLWAAWVLTRSLRRDLTPPRNAAAR